MSRKVLVITAGGLFIIVVALLTYLGGRPRITVINDAGVTLDEVRVQLPSSSVSFGPIRTGKHATIYYGWTQRPGVYKYRVVAGGQTRDGACGRVGNHEFGKHLELRVAIGLNLECE